MAEEFIQDAIKQPGALRATAESEGAMVDGKIKKSWLEEKSKGNDKTAKRARLALTLRGLKHG